MVVVCTREVHYSFAHNRHEKAVTPPRKETREQDRAHRDDAGRLGDRKAATAALDAVLAESRTRSPRATRCPSPDSVSSRSAFGRPVPRATRAPAIRQGEEDLRTGVPAGCGFKELVAAGKLPKADPGREGEDGRRQGRAGQDG